MISEHVWIALGLNILFIYQIFHIEFMLNKPFLNEKEPFPLHCKNQVNSGQGQCCFGIIYAGLPRLVTCMDGFIPSPIIKSSETFYLVAILEQ